MMENETSSALVDKRQRSKSHSINQVADLIGSFHTANSSPYVAEYKMITDVPVYGEAREVGPFSFINLITQAGRRAINSMKPAILLRVRWPESDYKRTSFDNNYQHYSGGDFIDEVAALVSLIFGAPMVGGSLRRNFGPASDPLGDPRGYNEKPSPYLDIDYARLTIPRAFTNVSVADLNVIDRIRHMDAAASAALIQSARLYQQALLLCETSPELAWLMLVSAVEVIANRYSAQTDNDLERFRQSHADLAEILKEHAEIELLLAKKMANLTKSAHKFRSFLVKFCPSPPENRPPPSFQVEMAGDGFIKVINRIYGCRSQHLHSGIAIPEPMCEPPRWYSFPDHPSEGYNEKPLGLGAWAKEASWKAEHCPILLYHFEFIARGAIMNWWNSIDIGATVPLDNRKCVYNNI